jgi:pimeloyl-ACP methyl ester carboxylesterase
VTVVIELYRVAVPDADLDDLRDRLARTRWPEHETVDDWSQGVPLDWLQRVCAYWADGYDWRSCERALNGFSQHRATLDGLAIHFLHARSPEPGAVPLLMTHGWPGSVVEFLDVVGPLSDPGAHGGDPADAFHVVCPSLPGYGFSERPSSTGWDVPRIAAAWGELMGSLGYDRYVAQGGDWGSIVTSCLGARDPRCVGIHLNMVIAEPGPDDQPLTEQEQAALVDLAEHGRTGTGYSTQQGTRPQTLGYGLVDSPVAQAAWILEKFWAWTDCDTVPEDAIALDRLLDNVSVYWFTATGASSGRLYWQGMRGYPREPVSVPSGMSIFPREIFRPSRRWAARQYLDIRHWHEADRGGHFAAMEQPDLFVEEVRACFRGLR